MDTISSLPITNWREIVDFRVIGWTLDLNVGVVFVLALIAVVLLVSFGRRGRGGWKVSSADFNFAGCATVTLCPTNDVARLAHQAWVELTTRKAAIPFDAENDVIIEVYDSWYALFKALRELAKSVPISKGMCLDSDESKLVDALTGALNEGLRPHLTRWQARFRRWYAAAEGEELNVQLSPQDIQRQFPEYTDLVSDLATVNAGLITFAESLRHIAHERERSPWWKFGSQSRSKSN